MEQEDESSDDSDMSDSDMSEGSDVQEARKRARGEPVSRAPAKKKAKKSAAASSPKGKGGKKVRRRYTYVGTERRGAKRRAEGFVYSQRFVASLLVSHVLPLTPPPLLSLLAEEGPQRSQTRFVGLHVLLHRQAQRGRGG